ncbi:MAG: hypothetical protein IPH72_07450 [Sandaracinaceae bacterium]|nr:hypothetical protein [Sandaracinaceae bacterium]MBK8592006.1 hypothetical protein [Sandaracinaceae bacterium]
MPWHVLLVALSTALLVAACGGQAGDPESETPSVEGDATSGSDTPEETRELPAESPRALGVGATFGDLVAAVRNLDGLGQSESAAGCLLRGGSLAPFHLEADLASAVHPIPDAPRELEARLDDPRDTAVVLTRWAQHGQTGSLTLVALSATPPPLPGHVAVVILGREGVHLRRTEGTVPAAHAGPFPTTRLAEHLPVVLEGAAGVVFTAEAGVPLGSLRAALGSLPAGSPPAILGLALDAGVRLPAAPAPDPSVHGLCPGGVLPEPAADQRLGSLAPDAIRARVAGMGEGAMRCFEYARGDAARGGRLRVLARIGPQGRVSEACATADELGDPTLRACVLGVVRGLVFPAPAEGDYVDVALPIRLLPDTSQQQRPLCDG